MESQQARARRAFTAQAENYANSAVIAADDARRRFVEFVAPRPADRVLDVATGPGFLAFWFAARTAEVLGVDVTPAMLVRAEALRVARGVHNVHFQPALAESLPFANGEFDLATCGSAFHHFADPARVLAEMIRVVHPGGQVALIDIITSEWPEKAALHNRLENWRDPSHTRCLPLSELITLFGQAGLHDLRAHTYETFRELDEWFAISQPPPDVKDRVRAAFLASIPNDATGLSVHVEGETVFFKHTFAWIVGTVSQPRPDL